MMMRNGNKVLVIGLVLLAGFASSASAVTKRYEKRLLRMRSTSLSDSQCPCSVR